MVQKLTRRQFNTALAASAALAGLGLPRAHAASGPVIVNSARPGPTLEIRMPIA